MYLGQAAASVALPGHHAQLEVGVPGEQPEQLASGISAGTCHRHPRAHVTRLLCSLAGADPSANYYAE
jgi:hypothetical protein